jgi:Flp pilus assembly protein TadB
LAVLVGVVLFVLTGWVAALALGPIIVLLAPTLLGAAPPTDIPLMEALDRWVRQVAAVLPQGRDIITAVRISRPRAPKLIAGSVDQLVSRLDGRMEPREAFQRMADELDSAEADAVLASLALAATHPRGASTTLKAIAGNIQQRLKVLRQVEAERSKPRNSVRQITLVTIAMFGGLLVIGRSFLAPLATPPGQVLVAVAVVMYVIALVQMYRMARPRRRTRIMVRRTR